jgi:hypothetical protein
VHDEGRPDELSLRGAEPESPPGEPGNTTGLPPDYAWTDLTYLLHKYNVSGATRRQGTQPDCEDNKMFCAPVPQSAKTPGIWNPLPWFDTVTGSPVRNIEPLQGLFKDLAHNQPPRSRGSSTDKVSDHPPASSRAVRRT